MTRLLSAVLGLMIWTAPLTAQTTNTAPSNLIPTPAQFEASARITELHQPRVDTPTLSLRRSGLGNGALIGAGIGFVGALGFGLLLSQDSDSGNETVVDYLPFALGASALGAIIGAAIGSRADLPPPADSTPAAALTVFGSER